MLIICGWRAVSRLIAPVPWSALPIKHRLSATPRYHRTYQPSMLIVLWFYVLTVQATSTQQPPSAQLIQSNHLASSQVRLRCRTHSLINISPCWWNLWFFSEFQHCRVLRSIEERWSLQAAGLLSGPHVWRSFFLKPRQLMICFIVRDRDLYHTADSNTYVR